MNCRGCGRDTVELVVDLGEQTAADYFPPATDPTEDPRWPLELWLCRACTLAQLGPVRPLLPEMPLAVESATSIAHAGSSVRALLARHPELDGATVAEFASHHGGSWLPSLRAAGCRDAGEGEPADLVVDVHGLAHEPDLAASLALRAQRLAPGGRLLLEFHHLLPLVEQCQFDTIRHGHWAYLSLGAIQELAAPLELRVTEAVQVPLFGGSLLVTLRSGSTAGSTAGSADETVGPSVAAVLRAERDAGLADPHRYRILQDTARRTATVLRDYLAGQRDRGRTVLGYGAPSKAPVLLDVSRVGPELLAFTVDAAPGKHGRRIPGAGVPIRPIEELRAARPDVVLILTWDIADEIVAQLEAGGGWGAEYVVPLPEPHQVGRPATGARPSIAVEERHG